MNDCKNALPELDNMKAATMVRQVRRILRVPDDMDLLMACRQAMSNLALHTKAGNLVDATREAAEALNAADLRIEALEYKLLPDLNADTDYAQDEGAAQRILHDLMRKLLDGRISLIHNV